MRKGPAPTRPPGPEAPLAPSRPSWRPARKLTCARLHTERQVELAVLRCLGPLLQHLVDDVQSRSQVVRSQVKRRRLLAHLLLSAQAYRVTGCSRAGMQEMKEAEGPQAPPRTFMAR